MREIAELRRALNRFVEGKPNLTSAANPNGDDQLLCEAIDELKILRAKYLAKINIIEEAH